jgi:nucleotide-binding universal stress UspA family protein
VQPIALEGTPGWTLVESSAHAGLVVVGSRGHGAVSSLLLGSVSRHCVGHGACPVVVVPVGEQAATG